MSRTFLTNTNRSLLFSIIDETIKNKTGINLDQEYVPELTNIMKHALKTTNRLPNVTEDNYKQTLNKKVLNEAIPIFLKSIRQVYQQPQQQQPVVYQQPQQQVIYQQPQQQIYNYQQQEQQKPRFEDPVPDNQPNVDSLYKQAEQYREYNDLKEPPNMVPEFAQNTIIRQIPTDYKKPSGQFSTNLSDLQKNQNNNTKCMIDLDLLDNDDNFNDNQQIIKNNFNDNLSAKERNELMLRNNPNNNKLIIKKSNYVNQNQQENFTASQYNQQNIENISQSEVDNYRKQLEHELNKLSNGKKILYTHNKPVNNNNTEIDPNYKEPPLKYKNPDQGLIKKHPLSPANLQENNPPQPNYMGLLIKKSNRNLVSDTEKIPDKLFIDSRDRNIDKYPNTYDYVIEFPEYKEVVNIQLLTATIPKSSYNINSSNNLIHFEETNGMTLSATVTPGFYTIGDLMTAIGNVMTAASGAGVTYTATYSSTTNKVTISSNAVGPTIFNLIFYGGTQTYENGTRTIYKDRSIGPVIGFKNVDQTGSLTYTSQGIYDLSGEDYLLLHINDFDNLDATESAVQNAFAVIPLDVALGSVKYYNVLSHFKNIKHFSPPKSFRRLHIQFKDHNGNFYDFNGLDHSLLFKILTRDETKSETN